MGRVLTNNTSLAYAIEASLGVLPGSPTWKLVEPNNIPNYGPDITTVARDPISKNRQLRKGTITDLDSAVQLESDLTGDSFQDFAEAFAFVVAVNADMDILSTSVDGADDEYDVAELTVAQANKLEFSAAEYTTLIFGRGFTNSGNNGLKSLDTDAAIPTAATGVLTFTGNALNGEIVTIDTKVYTFQTALTDVDGNVLIGVDAAASIVNLVAAIELGSGSGTLYAASTTLHPTVTAADGAGDTIDATAKTPGTAGNSIVTTTDLTNATWATGTLTGATGVTAIAVAEVLTAEAAPPANARVELAGLRSLAAATDLTWDWDGSTLTAQLISATDITDFTLFGLTVGQRVHVGSPDGSGGVTNAFQNSVANDMFGYARIRSFGTGSITFDRVATALRFDDLTAPTTAVDILFGQFIRNVPVDDTEFLERTFTFEAAWENLADPGPGDEFEYSKGNLANELAFALPLTDKATITPGFIGTDTDPPTGTRLPNADSPLEPLRTEAFNTSADIARLGIEEIDETGVSTDFKSMTITLNNNVSPEKIIGQLGARFMNFGNFEVTVETQALFTSGAVLAAIRNNVTVTLDFVITNNDGGIYVDIPAMTLGGGARNLPRNETVLVTFTGRAFIDPVLGISLGISLFPIVP